MKRVPRAYILLEVAIGGALLALLIATLLSQLSDARLRNVIAGRDAVAAQISQAQIERERATGYNAGAPSATCVAGPTVVASQTGVYNLACVSAVGTKAIGTQNLPMRTVTITVDYLTANGTRQVVAVTEVYQ